jgi:hypothetical protein
MRLSSADYAALLARRGQPASAQAHPEPRESRLHDDILDACRLRGYIANHGSTAHRTHRTLGEPDFIVLLPGGRTLLVECKRPGGKLSLAQQGYRSWAAKLGHTVHVATNLREFEALLPCTTPIPN